MRAVSIPTCESARPGVVSRYHLAVSSRVALLDPHTINQIAAGEVVERPASVVKELVENGLDAGATRVEVQIKAAGRELISVLDDGHGMSPEDARMALQRHATSKIRGAKDLLQITSLGFRGEGLPAIASVSKLTLTTATEDGEAFRLVVEYGKIRSEEAAPGRRGTAVQVAGLFENLPARLKFLKSDATETAQIVETVSRYVLAFPHVAFRLIVDSQCAIQSPGTNEPAAALAAIWGSEVVSALAEVDSTVSGVRVTGFVGPPHVNRHARTHQVVFVNRRPVRSKTLTAAIDTAYRDLTPERRYPIVMLNLDIAPSEVDVNVSPTKSEVKFHRESAVFDAVRLTIKAALQEHGMMPTIGGALAPSGSSSSSLFVRGAALVSLPGETPPDLFRAADEAPTAPGATAFTPADGAGEGNRMPFRELLDDLRILGQVQHTFIVVSTRRGLALVDQHVAHERVLYEYLCGLKAGGPAEVQRLLSPETVQFDKRAAVALAEHLDLLREAGFDLEAFGSGAYLVRGVPAGLKGRAYEAVLNDIVDQILESDGKAKVESIRERVLTTAACRMAVKAGDRLELPEMERLIEDLARTENPYMCPHGRPITLTLSWEELMRRFKRL